MFSRVKTFAKKKPYKLAIIILIIVAVIVLTITLPILLTKSSSNSNMVVPTSSTLKPTLSPTPSPTSSPTLSPTPPPTPLPSTGIVGAWAGTIGCGDGSFDIISLGSALPQDYSTTGLTAFFGKVVGNYDSNLSSGRSKYLISVGGSAASTTGWNTFLSNINSSQQNVKNFINGCKCRGIVGIDFDLEQSTKEMIPSIISLVNQIKAIDNKFIVMYTILLGSPDTYADLLNTSNYDYLSLMLYNGGMYQATGSGAGCDWDGWAELILSKGKAGCKYPLNPGCISNPQPSCNTVQSQFAQTANLSAINPAKVLLGLIIDTDKIKLDPTILARANQLNKTYGGGGIMIWVIPGWVNSDNITQLNNMGFKIDASKCSGGGGGCLTPKNPCSNGMSGNCVASSCGKSTQKVTDIDCAPCAKGQTWWPCNEVGFCEAQSGTPQPSCF
jgi:hypothetical protein